MESIYTNKMVKLDKIKYKHKKIKELDGGIYDILEDIIEAIDMLFEENKLDKTDKVKKLKKLFK